MNVLIVEDDHSIRSTLCTFCETIDIFCDEARTIEIALKKIKEKDFDVILIDMLMDGKVSGDIFDYYKDSGRKKPRLIMMTALQEAERLAAEFQPHALLKKPFDFDKLVALLH